MASISGPASAKTGRFRAVRLLARARGLQPAEELEGQLGVGPAEGVEAGHGRAGVEAAARAEAELGVPGGEAGGELGGPLGAALGALQGADRVVGEALLAEGAVAAVEGGDRLGDGLGAGRGRVVFQPSGRVPVQMISGWERRRRSTRRVRQATAGGGM